ncbi:2-acylglycerol O-acyltransferase 2-A-like [Drosophila hydei]|uniref:Acyltransferase n=1 Tax=Drosophila hydei TaxID=7224 RepID=A0A6J1LJE4_DROHY|nr:2-acylglycerol O-acyltransferase 2-A-like [Drosophila hydei]
MKIISSIKGAGYTCLELVVMAAFTSFFFTLPLNSLYASLILLFFGGYMVRSVLIIYTAIIYVRHKFNHSPVDGNGCMLMRDNVISRIYRNYFPVQLIKTAELPPNKNYIIASFPHGILGTGICINMAFDISVWLKLFPKVRPKVGTLNQHFVTPFLRHFLRCWGLISVSKESLMYFLTKSNDPKHSDNRDGFTSNAVAILVGGAQEALDSHPGQYILTLKSRKGFVKMAVRTGSAIVPSISFGEVDIFQQVANPPGSKLRNFQIAVKKQTGIAPLIPLGRDIFHYPFGVVPYRRPIVQVIGAPIDVVKNANPDAAYVDELHGKVMKALEELFEEHKAKYLPNASNTQLIIN